MIMFVRFVDSGAHNDSGEGYAQPVYSCFFRNMLWSMLRGNSS